VIHFEIHADDPVRARSFYEKTFGWTFSEFAGAEYWVITTGPPDQPGINGGLVRRRGAIDGTSVIAYVCTVQVDAVDAAVKKVVDAGGISVVPKMAIPGVGWLAYCKDTEGNIFGLMQEDPGAS